MREYKTKTKRKNLTKLDQVLLTNFDRKGWNQDIAKKEFKELAETLHPNYFAGTILRTNLHLVDRGLVRRTSRGEYKLTMKGYNRVKELQEVIK